MPKITAPDLLARKRKGPPITMVTAYDYPTAKLVDSAGIDVVLVGDSLGMVCLGYPDTVSVTMEEMLHHTAAAARGTQSAMVIADMPFLSYQVSVEEAVRNAGRFLKEGRADAVKLEGGVHQAAAVAAIVRAGIPVFGHIGLTPQTAGQLGGFKVQGRDTQTALRLVEDAKALEAAGAFGIVIECVPSTLAAKITSEVSIPTVGIGAGPHCDGQVLVFHDMTGLYDRFTPKFVKKYFDASLGIKEALKKYKEEVENRTFPGEEHQF
ncbi:3-methyl-2-oxobutanoate hydroxymethyltransferase [bacterium]|nr:MAG: 3-methyl-2-oxobutanoate hydroxymethyltransferase [bacterium]